MSPSLRLRALALVLTAALGVAACGGDDDTTSTTAATAATTATTAAGEDAATTTPAAESETTVAATEPAAVETLTLAVADAEVPAVPNAIGTLAATLGYYAAEGLEVEVVRLQGTPQVVAALQSGDADVGNLGTSDAVALVAQDLLDIVAINSSQKDLSFLIASTVDVADAADLEGKTYAISQPGGLDDTMAHLVLASLGVDVDAVQFVPIGDPAARAQAVANGVVAAGTMSVGAFQSIADNPATKVLVDPATFLAAAPIIQKVNVATAEAVSAKSTALEKFVTAQIKLARDFAADPAAWATAVAAERPDLDVANLEGITDLFAGSWCVNGCLNATQLEETTAFLYTTEDLAELPVITAEDWVDQSFVDAAVGTLGAADGEVDSR